MGLADRISDYLRDRPFLLDECVLRLHHVTPFPKPQSKTITIREVSEELAAALEVEKQHRGLPLNRTLLSLIEEALGFSEGEARSNGLRRLAGTWSEDEFQRFEEAVAPLGQIDRDLRP